jgi:hypothetical protein
MAQASDEILGHIEAQRAVLSKNVDELESRVKTNMDWRVQMERHPWAAVAFVGFAGLLIFKLFSHD